MHDSWQAAREEAATASGVGGQLRTTDVPSQEARNAESHNKGQHSDGVPQLQTHGRVPGSKKRQNHKAKGAAPCNCQPARRSLQPAAMSERYDCRGSLQGPRQPVPARLPVPHPCGSSSGQTRATPRLRTQSSWRTCRWPGLRRQHSGKGGGAEGQARMRRLSVKRRGGKGPLAAALAGGCGASQGAAVRCARCARPAAQPPGPERTALKGARALEHVVQRSHHARKVHSACRDVPPTLSGAAGRSFRRQGHVVMASLLPPRQVASTAGRGP